MPPPWAIWPATNPQMAALLQEQRAEFKNGRLQVTLGISAWRFSGLAGAPIRRSTAAEGGPVSTRPLEHGSTPARTSSLRTPFFTTRFRPQRIRAMWTLPVMENLFRALDPARPCALTTYSRSTMIRLHAVARGIFRGRGPRHGLKEETTIAANALELIAEPLDARWLERAARSDSAEPLREPVYSRAPIAPGTLAALQRQPQFISSFPH